MATTVYNQIQLNQALTNNADDIVFGGDITITVYRNYTFNHNINGDGHTLTLDISEEQQSAHWAFMNSFSGELHNLRVTGTIHACDSSYATDGVGLFINTTSTGYIHDVIVDGLTIIGNFASNPQWSLFNDVQMGARLENVWINNFTVVNTSTTNGRVYVIGRNLDTQRISVSNSTGMYPINNATSEITYGYVFNSNLNNAPAISGAAYNALSTSNYLYLNSNSTWSGGVISESDSNGRIKDSPNFRTMGFTEENHWDTSAGYPQLNISTRTITVTARDSTIAIGEFNRFDAVDSEGALTSFEWNFGDGVVLTAESPISHLYENDGAYTVTASGDGLSGSCAVKVIGVHISGNTYFLNDVPHTLTATGTFADEGTYVWSDGHTEATHVETYTGYNDGEQIDLSVDYNLDNATATDRITLTCIKGTLALACNPSSPSTTETATITSSFSGTETPTSQKLQHSLDGSAWTDLTPYSSSYSYTFTDTEPTTHYFRYVVVTPIEGTLEKTISVTTTERIIRIEGDRTVAFGQPSNFTAVDTSGIATTFTWDFDDGTILTSGSPVMHTYEEAGVYNVKATADGITGTFTARSIKVVISGDDYFFNGREHVLVADATVSGEGEYTWSDGEAGDTHRRTYTGYHDGDTITLQARFTTEGVTVTDTKTITCISGTLTLECNPTVTYFTGSTQITTGYSGRETPTSQQLMHSVNGTMWEILPYESPYTYTFADTEPTVHYFKYEVVTPMEGTIEKVEEVRTDVRTITVTGTQLEGTQQPCVFTAVDSMGLTNLFHWHFDDGTSITFGESTVTHRYSQAGHYTVAAYMDGVAGQLEVNIIGVTIEGDVHFANDVEHTITAVGSVIGEGEYEWSDGEEGAIHRKTYTGYNDGDTIRLVVRYFIGDVYATAETNLICVKGTLSLIPDKYFPSLDDTITLTSSYSGSETPTSHALKHSLNGETWEDLTPYSPEYRYAFHDTTSTTHYFKYIVTTPIEGTIETTLELTTVERGVHIVTPPAGANIFVDTEVEFAAAVVSLTDPVYEWSDGHTEPYFTKVYDTVGTYTMHVTATGVEGTYEDEVEFNIIPRGDFSIVAPSTFANNIPVTFSVNINTTVEVTWHFPDGTTLEGTTVTKTFSGYTRGETVMVTAMAEFTDDVGHSYVVTRYARLKCVFPPSYYENTRGEKFYFDESCVILRAGKSGFSEVQINTDVINGHDYNTVSGLTINNRAITFNVFVKGTYSVMHAKRRQMVHIMAPQKELGTFSYTRDDGEVFTMRCNIALGSPVFADEAVENGWVGTISFIAPNGVWEGAEITASTDNFIENIGDIPCGFEATLTGNLVNATNSESMQATTGTLSGYKVDTAKGIVLKQSEEEWVSGWGDVSLNSTLVVLEVGNNTITGCDSIKFKPLYLGV